MVSLLEFKEVAECFQASWICRADGLANHLLIGCR